MALETELLSAYHATVLDLVAHGITNVQIPLQRNRSTEVCQQHSADDVTTYQQPLHRMRRQQNAPMG